MLVYDNSLENQSNEINFLISPENAASLKSNDIIKDINWISFNNSKNVGGSKYNLRRVQNRTTSDAGLRAGSRKQ